MNIVSVRGGRVHAPSPIEDNAPLCRTSGQNQRGTRYTTTTAPVDCVACGPDDSPAAPSDPFAGIEDSYELDGNRPAVG